MNAVVSHNINGVQNRVLKQPVNVIPQPGAIADKPGFLVTQRNTLAHFRLADDEALVVTYDPGGAGYATFPITNVWGVSPDSRVHQNSLNDRQALHNADGTITLVLSAWNPGIANWVDTSGLHEGIIMLRWQLLRKGSASQPSVTSRLVRRADLAASLGAAVPRISPAERQAQLKARAARFDRRFAER